MTFCPKCNAEIGMLAVKCATCGHDFPPPEPSSSAHSSIRTTLLVVHLVSWALYVAAMALPAAYISKHGFIGWECYVQAIRLPFMSDGTHFMREPIFFLACLCSTLANFLVPTALILKLTKRHTGCRIAYGMLGVLAVIIPLLLWFNDAGIHLHLSGPTLWISAMLVMSLSGIFLLPPGPWLPRRANARATSDEDGKA